MPPPGRRSSIALTIVAVAVELHAQRHRAAPSTSDRFCDFGTNVAGVSVPAELCLRKFADVPTPRDLLFAPNGDLFVASPKRRTPGAAPPGAGAIFLFREGDLGTPPARITFAEGDAYQAVHGILIANGFFYYTVAEAVYRVPYAVGATAISPSTPAMVASFMPQSANIYFRFTHSLAAANDGSLYVS